MKEFTYTKEDWYYLKELCELNERDSAVLEIKLLGRRVDQDEVILWLQLIERVRSGEKFGERHDNVPILEVSTSASRAEWSARE